MKIILPSLFALMVLCLASCGTLESQHVLTGVPGAAHQGPVRIVMEGTTPPAELKEIALLQVRGTGNKADLKHAVEGLTTEARKLGCNYVVNVRVDQSGTMSATGICARGP